MYLIKYLFVTNKTYTVTASFSTFKNLSVGCTGVQIPKIQQLHNEI